MDLEEFHVVLPAGFDLLGGFALGNHLAHAGGAHQQVKEVALEEELVAASRDLAPNFANNASERRGGGGRGGERGERRGFRGGKRNNNR